MSFVKCPGWNCDLELGHRGLHYSIKDKPAPCRAIPAEGLRDDLRWLCLMVENHRCAPPLGNPTREEAIEAIRQIRDLIDRCGGRVAVLDEIYGITRLGWPKDAR